MIAELSFAQKSWGEIRSSHLSHVHLDKQDILTRSPLPEVQVNEDWQENLLQEYE